MSLPIDRCLSELQRRLREQCNLVLQAPPGAGKTSRVPLALLAADWLAERKIVVLEPRRLAARAAAERLAGELDEAVGKTVGYQIRFERRHSAQTRIEVVTEGILTRRLQHDPALTEIAVVIFDEFHERSLNTDLSLALCLDSQAALRPDLRLLLMSATLDTAGIARLLGNAPVVTTTGRSYPVTTHYLDHNPLRHDTGLVVTAIHRALTEHSGDVLVFLPGGAEIRAVAQRLETNNAVAGRKLAVLPLHGDLPMDMQQRALRPAPYGHRKIVLATNIAETSLTVSGISCVIDSGWTRRPRFQPGTGLTRLVTERVSQDSATQRAGRAGRLGPGACYRLWSEPAQSRLQSREVPEIMTADLAPLLLELALWGTTPGQLTWPDPPPPAALSQARSLLQRLGALDRHGLITATGRQLAELPLHPRLAHMVVRGAELGYAGQACTLAALLAERDILHGSNCGSDIDLRLDILGSRPESEQSGYTVDKVTCARIGRAAAQFNRLLTVSRRQPAIPADSVPGLLLAFAYPDRIARRRPGSTDRYQLASGRGAKLMPDDPLCGSDWLTVAYLRDGRNEGLIRLAARFEPTLLDSHLSELVTNHDVIEWAASEQAVTARSQQRLGTLVLSSRPLTHVDAKRRGAVLIEGIRRLGLDCLPWTPELRQWQARVATLHRWCPDQGWPDVSNERLLGSLEQWLAPWLEGLSRRSHLTRLDLDAICRHRLGWSLNAQLEEAAPTHLMVPSGSRIRIAYSADGEPPVLAVKLQELFGLTETPRLNGGRVPLVLHLLSPARRPVQITRDLANFWHSTYPQVKKELSGRYPKHPWPDDPWTASPTSSTRSQRR